MDPSMKKNQRVNVNKIKIGPDKIIFDSLSEKVKFHTGMTS
jgi:hypothetical protein